MYFQIKEIILWPKNQSFKPRRLPFETGKVNIISGASRTGKSAVIPIIDYCLGSSKCLIPVNTIRTACAWFGVIVQTAAGEKLFARPEPGEQRSTDEMYIQEALTIKEIPESLSKNTNRNHVRAVLDELAGLTNLDFGGGESQSGFDARPGFRDLSAFIFQPQNVIANPDVLFYKTNTYEHREKLIKIFPYILGAITPELLAKQYELKRLQTELKRKEREMKNAQEFSAQWLAELRAKVSEAREFGLLSSDQAAEPSREEMIQQLRGLVDATDVTIAVTESTISGAMRELQELESEESLVSNELSVLRKRLGEMNRIRKGASNYHHGMQIQRERLQVSSWLTVQRSGDEGCPVCGGHLEASADKLEKLNRSLVAIEEEAGGAFEIPPAFDREMQRVSAEITGTTEKLRAVQIRTRALTQRSADAQKKKYQTKMVERFIGRLENALQLQQKLAGDGELIAEVEQLRERVQQLDTEVRHGNPEARKRQALDHLNANAARLLPYLDSERPNDPVSLEIKDLTVKVTGNDRSDYLSEIGSGSNWLSYHVAMILALHQFFISLRHSPVPGFVVIDQPSQVYFPKKVVLRENEESEEPQFKKDEDIAAVRKVFNVLGSVVGTAKGKLQVIVLDHAPRDVWGGIDNVVGLEEWRDGLKLVPVEWVESLK
ncbi:MAG: DUF3732 domain-containing protein [Desulfuromonadales bacterium]